MSLNITNYIIITKMKKIICFVSMLSQPRCIKRILSLHYAGYNVIVYGHDRGLYNINMFPSSIEVHNLGFAKNGSGYLLKFLKNWKLLIRILNEYDKNSIIVYAFSFDFALISSILKFKYIYEISDLIYGYFKCKTLMNIFRLIDIYICKKSIFTVITSEGFKKYLFRNKNNKKIILQKNKVDYSLKNILRFSLNLKYRTSLRFAYVGAFRYPNTVFRFAEVIGREFPKHEFYFYGESNLTNLVIKLSNKYPNIYYFGPFKNPDELEEIYKNIDIIAACYDVSSFNERVAEPNKLYEAICFCKPIIVSKNTYLADKVKTMGVGYSIDASKDETIIEFVSQLSINQLNIISMNEYKMDSNEYIDNSENIISNIENLCFTKSKIY